MFKKVYQFSFAFVLLLTCSFFVSDNVFADTGRVHTGNITIEKPSSDNLPSMFSNYYNEYLRVYNYYLENYSSQYPYYFFVYNVNYFTYYIFTENNYRAWTSLRIYYLGEDSTSTGVKIFLNFKNNKVISPTDYSLSSVSSNVSVDFGSVSSTYYNHVSNLTRTLYIDTNISLYAVPYDFDNVIVNNVDYSTGDIISFSSIPTVLDTKINNITSRIINIIYNDIIKIIRNSI